MTLITTTYDSKTHKIVPIEPTEEMLERGYEALMDWDARTGEDMSIWQMYRGMLTAAPTHPTSTIKENQMEQKDNFAHADMLIKVSNLETAIELLPEDADRENLLIKAGNLKSAIECAGCE